MTHCDTPETATIPLTRGLHAVVDRSDADQEFTAFFRDGYCWTGSPAAMMWRAQISSSGKTHYAVSVITGADGKRRLVYLHRLLTQAAAGMDVDHRNHDGLDNRRHNLRACTRQQNLQNRLGTLPHRQYKGVDRPRNGSKTNPFVAKIRINSRLVWLGSFPNAESAARAYDAAAVEAFGEYACLNGA